MDPWIIILIALALMIVFLLAETVVPSGGVLGVCAALCAVTALVAAFYVNKWLGLGMLAAGVPVGILLSSLLVKVWQHTPVGKAVVLNTTMPAVEIERVPVGAVGRTVSVLRPMGEAEFGMITAQVISDLGTIEPGKSVKVIAVSPDGVARVRVVEES
jgi:membrane-bound ClpP family serine protease